MSVSNNLRAPIRLVILISLLDIKVNERSTLKLTEIEFQTNKILEAYIVNSVKVSSCQNKQVHTI